MTQSEDAVLVREIGRLALFGGRFGARLAARRLPVEEHETAIAIAVSADQIRPDVCEILQSVGKLTDEFAAENDRESASAIVGSGHLNLNPTIVHVNLSNLSDGVTQLSIRALAKEGLVKQQSAKRAVERIVTLISNRYAEQIVGPERGKRVSHLD
jgi:hypothetical protein